MPTSRPYEDQPLDLNPAVTAPTGSSPSIWRCCQFLGWPGPQANRCSVPLVLSSESVTLVIGVYYFSELFNEDLGPRHAPCSFVIHVETKAAPRKVYSTRFYFFR